MLKKSLFIVALAFMIGIAYAGSKMISGTVQNIDAKAGTVTINQTPNVNDASQTFKIGARTVYQMNGKETLHISLKPGDKISVELGDDEVAKSINVQSQ